MRRWLAVAAVLCVSPACEAWQREEREPTYEAPKTYTPRYKERYKFEPTSGPDSPWWCSDAQTRAVTCDRLRSDCDLRRRVEVEAGLEKYATEPCVPQVKAACFERKHKLSGKIERACYTDFTICRNIRDQDMRAWTADWDVAVDCKAE